MRGLYRERLGIQVGPTSRFSALRNKQLKAEALLMAAAMTQFYHRQQGQYISDMAADRTRVLEASTEERERLQSQGVELITRRMLAALAVYDERFKVDAILLRDEMLSRIKEDKPGFSKTEFMKSNCVEHPTNWTGIKDVATRLEQLASLLPM
jgi:hypothetical protein